MVIKTITCHNVYNYGASLQEFALLQYLKSKGHDASAINYRPAYLDFHFNLLSVENKKFRKNKLTQIAYILLKAPVKILSFHRKNKFDEFSRKFIPSTSTVFRSNTELKQTPPQADIFICGSDQIWNPIFPNGKDLSFYLGFVPNNRIKASYAASFATRQLSDKQKNFVHSNLSKFNAISVRESSGVELLKELKLPNVNHVLDPVFLIERKSWAEMSNAMKYNEHILVYDFDNNPTIKAHALELKKQYGSKIISLNKNIKYCDINLWLQGPLEFLTLVKQAKYILSNSFHAIAFSIIFEKEFFAYNRNEKLNERITDLLKILDLEQRHIIQPETLTLPKSTINYTRVKDTLKSLIYNSENFLESILNNQEQ